MARARNIKPSFFQNEELGELTPIERLAFIGMWTIADFKGCIEFRPKRIKVQLLPYDDCDFEQIAINLDKSGLIQNYSVQGKRYLKIVNFEKHQNPHKNERDAGSDIPDIDKIDIEINELKNIGNNRDKDGTNPADSLILNPDSLILNPESKVADAPGSLSETNKDEPEKTEEQNIFKFLLPDWVDKTKWDLWMKTRKGRKMIPEQKQAQINKLEKWKELGLDHAQALSDAADAGWQGLIEPKQKSPNPATNRNSGYVKQLPQRPVYTYPGDIGDAIDSTAEIVHAQARL